MENQKLIMTQIDLARRKENASEIKAFLDHAHRFGFNAVLFYLEDRIRTKSYPYPSKEESYSPEEMRELVKYAEGLGIEIIPVVSNQCHAERFLRFEELLPTAELYGNIKGRFNEAGAAYYNQVCTENPKTYEFFDTYFREIAEIFPSKYFHAGLDEGFNIGMCKRCRARFDREGGFEGIFLDHLKHTNDLLHSLGKTMMMWDDMFYMMNGEALSSAPRDIVMLSWNYEYVDRAVGSQFRNNKKRELYREYERLGISYIPACWSNFDFNIDTITALGERFSPMGYLATTWQMGPEPLLYNYVALAYAGLLWNGVLADDPDARLKKAVRETLDLELSDGEAAAIGMAATKTYANRLPTHFYIKDGKIVRRNVNFDEENKLDRMLYDLLSALPYENKFIDFYKSRIKNTLNVYRRLVLAQKLYDYLSSQIHTDKQLLISDLLALRESQLEEKLTLDSEWSKYRVGIPKDYEEDMAAYIADTDNLIELASTSESGQYGALDMNLLLPDKSTRVIIKLTAEYTDGETEILAKGTYKPYATSCYNISEKGPYVYNVTFLCKPKAISKLRVEVCGFGSANINYFVQRLGKETLVPVEVESFGKVQNPERLLSHDTLSCEIGEGDMILPFRDPALADKAHGVVVTFMPD